MRRNMPPSQGHASASPSAILYIGSLPFDWDEDNLKSVVCGLGNVLDVRLGFDHVGKNKGFAFVEFENPQSAQIAMQLLSKVQVMNPQTNQMRKLRVELSKEGFRTGNNDHKSVIPLNAVHLPHGVQFPPEVLANNPQLQRTAHANFSGGPPLPMQRGTPPLMQSPSGGNSNMAMGAAGGVATVNPPNSSNTIPEQSLRATQFLPQTTELPFATPDNINHTLSQIAPPQLIELIANLKNILNSSNSARAADVFRISPHLATAATQALLLMGFVDEEVIQEAMKSGGSAGATQTQQAPAPAPAPQNTYPNTNPGYGMSPSYGNAQPQGQNYVPQRNFGQPHPQKPNPGFGQNSNSGSLPPAPSIPATPTRWPNLSLSTQMKLANVPKEQAELIVQVLSLTNDQIQSLPPDRQNMVMGIRQQYL